MNLEKLKKQLVRDFKKSPGKAAALGALTLVGLWWWFPLVKPLLVGKEKSASSARAKPAVEPSPAAVSEAVPAASADDSYDWKRVATWLDVALGHADSPEAMRLATGVLGWKLPLAAGLFDWVVVPQVRDPFQPVVERQRKALVVVAPPEPTVTAEDLGLELSSTIVGARQRVALIGDRAIREGASFQAGGKTLVLVRVEPRRALVQRNGQTFELKIQPPRFPTGLALSTATTSD